MLGTRGVRLAILKPGLYRAQVRAIIDAARERRAAGGNPMVEILIPLVADARELVLVRDWIAEEVSGDEFVIEVGTMIETPRAALLAGELAASGAYSAIACVGAVVRGETPHFDFVAGEAARGIMEASRETGVPLGFGVITADTLEQAAARINAPSPPPAASGRLTPSRASGTSELLLTSLGRDKCRDILPRLLGSSGRIGSTVLLNGQPVNSAHGCRSSGNRIEVLM